MPFQSELTSFESSSRLPTLPVGFLLGFSTFLPFLIADHLGDHPDQSGPSFTLDPDWQHHWGAPAAGSDYHLFVEGKSHANGLRLHLHRETSLNRSQD